MVPERARVDSDNKKLFHLGGFLVFFFGFFFLFYYKKKYTSFTSLRALGQNKPISHLAILA
jgi:hypothetical protein